MSDPMMVINYTICNNNDVKTIDDKFKEAKNICIKGKGIHI